MIDRLASGWPRLDAILGGGLPRNSITIVAGLPGSGKTLLAQQYVFANATTDAPAVYCTTASEPLDKLVRYGQTLGFFDVKAIGSRVFYEDLGAALLDGGLGRVQQRLAEIVRDVRPAILVIDSFRAMAAFAADRAELRSFVAELAGRLTAVRTTALWVGEYDLEEVGSAPEAAVADGIIALGRAHEGERVRRELEVLKLRGSGFLSGRHVYRLSERGLEPFPRLADESATDSPELEGGRLGSGLPALDEMLGGGFLPGTATLIAGPSGVGKTTLGLQILAAGASAGEPTIVASLEESPRQVRRLMRSVGWDEGNIDLFYRSPVDLYLDEWVYALLDRIDEIGARRVLIDSLTDLQLTTRDQVRFDEYLYSLVQRLSRQGVLTAMTLETGTAPGGAMAQAPVSHLADNVLVLRYIPISGELQRTIFVLKTRSSSNDRRLRLLTINQGVEIGSPLDVAAELL